MFDFVLASSLCMLIAMNAAGQSPTAAPDQDQSPKVAVAGQEVQAAEIPLVDEAVPADPVGQLDRRGGEPIDPQRILTHLPDPTLERSRAEERLATEEFAKSERLYIQRVIDRVSIIGRSEKLPLTLEDAIQRAMANSLTVRVSSYDPAINTARAVEAEAAFDASFFANFSRNKQNRPSASALIGSNVDTQVYTAGLTKLLANGMRATTTFNMNRTSNDFQFQDFDPVWNSAISVELRQPFARGFGIDFNRSGIRLAQLDRRISRETFRRQVIDTLVDVEQAYWNLVSARREVAIQARLLGRFEQIYEFLLVRRTFDAYKIQISDTKARLETSKAAFIQAIANVRNAEDRLINLMNDPRIDLADDVEILPLDFPGNAPVVLDRLSEVQIALDHRPELSEADLRVKQARIAVGQAKNQILPQFDVTFRYTVDGLGISADDAFDEVTKNDFHEYFISLEFEIPVGNRGPKARLQQARLRHGQSMAGLKLAFENVILDVNIRLRNVESFYDQIAPNLESAEANKDQAQAIKARAESKNFVQLNQELNALTSLASSRRNLLRALIDFNMAIIELERAKGTLPEYDNVIITSDIE